MDELAKYVNEHTIRGACTCGKCIDSPLTLHPELTEQYQPQGHTADVIFFRVSVQNNPDKETFLTLVRNEFPSWLDGKEHGYMEMGGDMGDQGIALKTQALGSLLGAWTLITPNSFGNAFPKELKMEMAGRGFVTIQYSPVKGAGTGEI